MDCRVVVEAAVPVYDVETADEAVRIAISKTGEMLNPDLNYVEISMGQRACPNCGDTSDPAFIAADEGLVALELEMTVFNVERDEHASRIARKEIGQRLQNIPLEVVEVEVIDEDEDDDQEAEAEAADEDGETEDDTETISIDEADTETEVEVEADPGADSNADEDGHRQNEDDDEDVLPEFEDLMDE